MLPLKIVYFLIFFDVWGYDSGSSSLSHYRRIIYFIYIFHIFAVSFFTVFKLHLARFLWSYHHLNMVELVNVTMLFSAPLYTYWIIILDSLYHRYEHKQFWNILQHIDNCFCRQTNSFQNYITKISAYFSISISLFLLLHFINNFKYFDTILVYLILITICQIRIFYYLFCLEVIQFQLKIIEIELKNMHSNVFAYVKRLKWFREYYGKIHEMTILLNEIFGWSNVSAILFSFYNILTDVNIIYAQYDEYSTIQRLSMYKINS